MKSDCKVKTQALEIIKPVNECTGRLSWVKVTQERTKSRRIAFLGIEGRRSREQTLTRQKGTFIITSFSTERKAIIRNRYNYLSSKIPKGKKDALKATTPQSKECRQKAQNWPNGYPK